jgi:hypothetical protein
MRRMCSTVTVFAGSGFINCENHGGNTPEAVLGTIADAMANLGTFSAGQSVVMLAPEHVGIVAAAGWSKAQVRQYRMTTQALHGRPRCGS